MPNRPYRVHYREAEQAARLTRQVLLRLCANLPRNLSCRTDIGNALVQRLTAKLGNQQSDKSFSGSNWQFDITEENERQRREKVIGKVPGLDRVLEDTLPYLRAARDRGIGRNTDTDGLSARVHPWRPDALGSAG